MAWWDWVLGPLDVIHAATHTIARQVPTRARNRQARHESGAVLIRVPHPDAKLRKEAMDRERIPYAFEVEDHLQRHGVRTWHGRFDGAWLNIVARESQRSQVEWLLCGQLDVTDRDQMRGWARRWADAPADSRTQRKERRERRRGRR